MAEQYVVASRTHSKSNAASLAVHTKTSRRDRRHALCKSDRHRTVRPAACSKLWLHVFSLGRALLCDGAGCLCPAQEHTTPGSARAGAPARLLPEALPSSAICLAMSTRRTPSSCCCHQGMPSSPLTCS